MSAHPARCAGCRGSGYMDGPPIIETIGGHPHRYTTVAPCDHDWWHDDTGWDPHHDEPLGENHPRARATFDAGYLLGLDDLWHLSGGQLGVPMRQGAAV